MKVNYFSEDEEQHIQDLLAASKTPTEISRDPSLQQRHTENSIRLKAIRMRGQTTKPQLHTEEEVWEFTRGVEEIIRKALQVPNPDITPTFPVQFELARESKPIETMQEPLARLERPRPTHGTFAASGDWHIPYENSRDLSLYFEFLHDFKPDLILFMGDLFDLQQLSSFEEGRKVKLATLPTVLDDYSRARRLLEPLRYALPDSYWLYVEGNHEERITRAKEYDGAARDYELQRHFGDLFDEFLPYRDERVSNLVHFGKLWFGHGVYYNEYHSKKNAIHFNRPIRTWHAHTVQSHTLHSGTDVKDYRIAWSCPCLCDRNPHWKRHQPNSWVHGFVYGEVLEDGEFQDSLVVINQGKFRAAEKWYGL